MTKKDFELIASVLRDVRESYAETWDQNLRRACDDHARAFAERLLEAHPRFQEGRFLTAAGV